MHSTLCNRCLGLLLTVAVFVSPASLVFGVSIDRVLSLTPTMPFSESHRESVMQQAASAIPTMAKPAPLAQWCYRSRISARVSPEEYRMGARFSLSQKQSSEGGKWAIFGLICHKPLLFPNLRLMRGTGHSWFAWFAAVIWITTVSVMPGQTATQLGDIDGDGVATVRDLVLLRGHMSQTQPLGAAQAVLADLTKDGFVNQSDADEIVKEILQTRNPEQLPLATVRESSPSNGEGDVALTRETIVNFSIPLSPSAALDTTKYRAEFGGRNILSRVEISSDRKKATLFYLEPLPSNARLNVTLDGSGLTDLLGRAVDLNNDGVAGGIYRQTFDTLSITSVAGTAISGRVFASERATGGSELPLAGVTITVDGAEETLRTTTDAQGNFTLSPCPAGSFFVHIDGRTSPQSSYPNGDYFPTVGKRWEAIAGRTDNLSGNSQDTARGTIYLPCICNGSLHSVSQTQDTPVEFPAEVLTANPELAGTRLDVPANSLFADDGNRGGKVGIAPVAPDRLPSPLPPGLNLPMVITIQTDGATNFERPVPICLPNLPDPVTGEKLPPRAKSALWSFNHDIGDWEVVGPMTVTEDGNFVKTDAGVGVRQPGWHGQMPGTQLEGPDDSDDGCHATDINWLSFGFNAAGSAAACAKGFVDKEYKKVRAVLKAFATAKKLKDLTEKLLADMSNGRADCAARRVVLHRLKEGIKELEKAFAGGLELANPLSKVVAVAKCLEDAMKLFDPFCEGLDEQPECFSWLGRKACGLRAGIETRAKRFRQMADIVAKAATNFALGPLQYGVTTLEYRLDERCNAAGVAPEPATAGRAVRAAEAAPAAIDTSDEAFMVDALNIIGALEAFDEVPPQDASGDLDQLVRDSAAVIGALGDAYIGKEGRVANAFVRVDYDTTVQRLRANASGRMRLTLPPDTPFSITLLDPVTFDIGTVVGFSPGDGSSQKLPGTVMSPDTSADTDGDGLSNDAEDVIGTQKGNRDTDGDGVLDGAEIQQGTDPLDGFIAQTGVVASVPVQGGALDVAALNNLAAVASGSAGVTIFNVFSGLNPVRLAQIDTPGNAYRVAISASFVAVADGTAGLAIIDLSDSANPVLARQISLGGAARCVATDGLLAFVGLDNGRLAVVDMATGTVLKRDLVASGSVHDVSIAGDRLGVLDSGRLYLLDLATDLRILGSVSISGSISPLELGRRLLMTPSVAYVGYFQGFSIVDVSNPAAPMERVRPTTTQAAVHSLAANGSGLLVPVTSFAGPSTLAVSLYDITAGDDVTNFITSFDTPGDCRSATIYNGLAYVADSAAGLQVVSYLAYDDKGQAPTIALGSSFAMNHTNHTGTAEEGKLMRLSGVVTDDVQVRNVEFYLNDELLIVDGNFPFEHRFTTPAIAAGGPTFKVKAKATDTGGNIAWTDEYTITLVPDATPPQVLSVVPANNALVGRITSLYATFNEHINPATLDGTGFRLTGAGPDKVFGTGDDFSATGAVSYRENLRAAFMSFPSVGLVPSNYRLVIQAPVADAAGNQLGAPFTSTFQVYNAGIDTDGDGIPDDVEVLLGLNPAKADSDNDGTPDGQEDRDNDSVSNAAELFLGLNPLVGDSDGDGVPDGLEDEDRDGLYAQGEFAAKTDPFNPDTDGDGWTDEAEVTGGGDPLDAQVFPKLFVTSVEQATVRTMVLLHQQANSGYGAVGSLPQAPISVFVMQHDATNAGYGTISTQPEAPVSVFVPVIDFSTPGFGFITNQPQARPSVRINP